MATLPKDDGKALWQWFECSCYDIFYKGEYDRAKLHQDIESRWPTRSKDFKDKVLAPVIRVQAALKRYDEINAKIAKTPVLNLSQWQEAQDYQLEPAVDCTATADDRMAVLEEQRTALDEVKSAWDALNAAQRVEKREWFSHVHRQATLTAIKGFRADSDRNLDALNTLKQQLPELRRLQEGFRRRKQEAGYPDGAGWVGSWFLGKGSFGEARLFVRQDHHGLIVNRIVTKDVKITENLRNEESAWTLHEGVWVPTEVRVPQILDGKEGSETILSVRGWREFRNHDIFRILLDFCPFGDLFDYLNLQVGIFGEDVKIPEPFIWYVFEALATAGVLMENGELNPRGFANWQWIFHSDIKASNIMLSTPNPHKYCVYPQPVVADFGFAQLAPWGSGIARGGTPGAESPENSGRYWQKDGKFVPGGAHIGPKSDVWSVGNVIYGLMANHESLEELAWRYHPTKDFVKQPNSRMLEGKYSDTLIELVRKCMEYYVEDRLNFSTLLQMIKMYTGEHHEWGWDHVHGLRTTLPDDQRWKMPGVQLIIKPERWPMYSHLARGEAAYVAKKNKLSPENKQIQAMPIKEPPFWTKNVEEWTEYKGPVSADSTPLSRAGSVRKHAAGHTRQEHLEWRRGRNEEAAARRTIRASPPAVAAGAKQIKQGYFVPTSSDSAGSVSRVADSIAAGGNEEIDFTVAEPNPSPKAKKSRSAAAGAGRSASPSRRETPSDGRRSSRETLRQRAKRRRSARRKMPGRFD